MSQNPQLNDLEGLRNVTRIGVDLTISENAAVASLDGLSGLTSIGRMLTITDNAALPSCSAEWLLDHVGTANIGGLLIAGNDDTGVCAP